MNTAKTASLDDRALTQRARVRTMLQRRRRLWRRVTVSLVVAVAMVLAILLNRDTQHLRIRMRQGEKVAAALQRAYDRTRDPPLSFPTLDGAGRGLYDLYYFNIFYASRQESDQQVGVCCLREPVRFFLRTEGRVVVTFDGSRFSSQWMPESDFQNRAKALGFASLLEE